MAPLPSFSTPANQKDFPDDPAKQQELDELWSFYVHAFLLQAQTSSYFDPLVTDISEATTTAVFWVAFPGRVTQYLGAGQFPENPYNWRQDKLNAFADTGTPPEGVDYPSIPDNPCNGNKSPRTHAYGPWGPRGWQDEYCEWSVTRDDQSRIIRIDFTCENPEYWYTLWRTSPETAAAIYESTLNHNLPAGPTPITVTVDDLTLKDDQGNRVIDPSTGKPAYNPFNKWNTGPVSVRTPSEITGGAMHLTSTPNTLQTETGLAGAATVQRTGGPWTEQALICCSQYGQIYRNSDPHIGASVNGLIVQNGKAYVVSLANPVGLYIQTPDFSTFGPQSILSKVGGGAQFSDCWQVVRGTQGQPGEGDHILHAAFQLPQSWVDAGITIDQIEIAGTPITHGSQVAATISMAIYAWGIESGPVPDSFPCVEAIPPPSPGPPVAVQAMFASLWNAYYGTPVANPMSTPMNLASNTVIVPPIVPQGASGVDIALTCLSAKQGIEVSFPPESGPADIKVSNVSLSSQTVNYAPPGNSFPSENQLLTLTLDVDATAATGLRSIALANPGDPSPTSYPAYLLVVEKGQFGT